MPLIPSDELCWRGPSQLTGLTSGAIHLWKASLDIPPDRLRHRAGLLSEDEIERANRLRSPASRRFVVARGTLRLILGRYLHCPPDAINFAYSDRGKPLLGASHSQPQLQFNLSHSRDVAVYALISQGDIGVDVEYVRPVSSLLRLAHRYFSEQEQADLKALSGPLQVQRFFDLWTQKEAYIKATGEGIQKIATAKRPETWSLSSLQIGPEFRVAVTASNATGELQLFSWK